MPDSAIVSASDIEAVALLRAGGPLVESFTGPAVVLGSMTPLDVITLAEIVTGQADGSLSAFVNAPAVAQKSDDGPWLFRLPDAFADALIALDPEKLPEVVTRWKASFSDDDQSEAELHALLTELIAHARAQSRKPLLVWCEL
jgi:hypothetical protein